MSGISQTSTTVPALNYLVGFFCFCFFFFLESQNLGMEGACVAIPLLIPRLAPALHLPGGALVGLNSALGKCCAGEWKKRRSWAFTGPRKQNAPFHRRIFRIGLGEGSKELVER